MDDAERERKTQSIVRWMALEVPAFPLLRLQNVWAVRRGLVHDPRMDRRMQGMGVRPATN